MEYDSLVDIKQEPEVSSEHFLPSGDGYGDNESLSNFKAKAIDEET